MKVATPVATTRQLLIVALAAMMCKDCGKSRARLQRGAGMTYAPEPFDPAKHCSCVGGFDVEIGAQGICPECGTRSVPVVDHDVVDTCRFCGAEVTAGERETVAAEAEARAYESQMSRGQ